MGRIQIIWEANCLSENWRIDNRIWCFCK